MTDVLHQLRRVNPVPGMMIDVETWRTAHDYHRDHARLHNLALHGRGIVMGLDVVVGESVNALLIQPGVALDSAGNFVIVEREQVHRLAARGRGMIYLALRYRDAPAEPDAAGAGPQTRVIESFTIEERTLPPSDTDLELARIDFDPQQAPIRSAADPQQPGRNEVDIRWRVRAGAPDVSAASPPAPDGVAPPEPEPEPAPAPAPQVPADVLERLDVLDRRVQQLAAQLSAAQLSAAQLSAAQASVAQASAAQASAAQVSATPATETVSAALPYEFRERVDDLARQVAALWARLQSATSGASVPATVTDATITNGVSDALLVDLRQRFDRVVHQLDDLGGRVTQLAAEREELSRQQQAFDGQLGSLIRQGEDTAPELARMRDGLDRVTPEIERLTAFVEPLERQVQQLVDRSESLAERAWHAPDASVGRELRLAVARMQSAGWDQHREGFRFLGRELVATVEPLARVIDEVQLSEVSQVELLYLTGFAALGLDDAEVQGIARVLESGGVVLAEGCAAGPSGETGAREFAFSFIELAQRLGRRLTRVERGHRLLEARYIFGEPPAGARPARVLEAGGMIYSDADYGCAWQGGPATQSLARPVIREAFEFGVNIAIYHQPRG
jgi:polyhydroxyalkanoate synthesis regulator phasin